jgi:hypothetical protein
MVETGATRRAEEKGYHPKIIFFLFPVAVKILAAIVLSWGRLGICYIAGTEFGNCIHGVTTLSVLLHRPLFYFSLFIVSMLEYLISSDEGSASHGGRHLHIWSSGSRGIVERYHLALMTQAYFSSLTDLYSSVDP